MKRRKMPRWVLVFGMALIIGASIAVSVPPEVSATTPQRDGLPCRDERITQMLFGRMYSYRK
jgi:hypothetical protein